MQYSLKTRTLTTRSKRGREIWRDDGGNKYATHLARGIQCCRSLLAHKYAMNDTAVQENSGATAVVYFLL